jgi:hypothetical protein
MFDLTTISLSGSGDEDQWTAVLFQQTHLPAFACIPNSWSMAWLIPSVSFDPEVGDQMAHQAEADFQKAYHLSLPEKAVQSVEDEVRRLFRPPRLEALARCPGWYIESTGSCLVFARVGTARAADRPALWREAIELRRALLAPVSSEPTPDGAPAPKIGRRKPRSRPHRDKGSSRVEDEVCSWLTKDADANDRDRPRELPDQERHAADRQGQPSGADSRANSTSDARALTALPAESPRSTQKAMFAPYAWDEVASGLLALTMVWNGVLGVFIWVQLSGEVRGEKPGWLFLSPFILIGVLLLAAQVAYLIRAVKITRADKLARSRLGCEVRLISPVNGVSGIPTEGKNLIIVAAVDHVLHSRIFDSDGRLVVDTDEKRPRGQARQIENLRKQLESLWPPHELTGVEKGRVITAVTSIVGRTPWT